MDQEGTTALFFELFTGLPRQGPGDRASTLQALALVPGVGARTRILDLGCGTGTPTLVLAQNSPARILAIDNHQPFVDELKRTTAALGLSDRVEARVGDMGSLDLAAGSVDLIWSEGAIFVMGFEAGLRDWRRLLAPGGHIAVTEVCWTKPTPPAACAAYWAREYPAIRHVPVLLKIIADCGYETVGHFPLPSSSWWDDYYRPLQRNIAEFRARHRDEDDAQKVADQAQREIDLWQAYSEFYGYEFFVMRASRSS